MYTVDFHSIQNFFRETVTQLAMTKYKQLLWKSRQILHHDMKITPIILMDIFQDLNKLRGLQEVYMCLMIKSFSGVVIFPAMKEKQSKDTAGNTLAATKSVRFHTNEERCLLHSDSGGSFLPLSGTSTQFHYVGECTWPKQPYLMLLPGQVLSKN